MFAMIDRLSYFSEKLMLQGDNFGVIAGRKDRICASVHGVIELVEIPNNKSQITNKFRTLDLP
jgi:hypothetical protein